MVILREVCIILIDIRFIVFAEAFGDKRDAFPEILRLAEPESTVRLMAQEIGTIRRRVNALEYFFIPQLQETIKYIRFKLDEIERSNNARLMKIKDIIRSH